MQLERRRGYMPRVSLLVLPTDTRERRSRICVGGGTVQMGFTLDSVGERTLGRLAKVFPSK